MYQIRTPTTTTTIPSVVMGGGGNMQSPQQMAEEASRKREMRLMKNRLVVFLFTCQPFRQPNLVAYALMLKT